MIQEHKMRRWLGLLALMPAVAMIFIDQSVLPVALPTIQKELGGTHTELWWCINAYLLLSAVLLLLGGKIGEWIGYRRVFSWGILIFALSSLLCGLSQTIDLLIGARALQGVGAALLIPASSSLTMSLFPQNERGKALGLNISISSIFLVLAPLIGGYFTQELSWRWIFWINLPLAAAGLILVLLFIPASPKGTVKSNPLGFFFFIVSSSALIMLIMQGPAWGWGSFASLSLFVLCLVSAFFLFREEKRARYPLFDLSLFRHPIYQAITISVSATQFVLMITIYRAIFFQQVLDLTPLNNGLILFFTSLPLLFMAFVGGWLADRSGPKIPLALGFTLLIYSFFWLAFFIQMGLGMVVMGLLAFSIGVPLIFTPSYSSAMGVIPPKKSGSAFGILATARSFSASLGVAVIGAFSRHVQLHSFQDLLEKNPETHSLNASALETQSTLAPEQTQLVSSYLKESQVSGFFWVHLAIGLALIIAFALVFIFYHRKASHHLPETSAEGWD